MQCVCAFCVFIFLTPLSLPLSIIIITAAFFQLLKTKYQSMTLENGSLGYRMGIRIRANPGNSYILTNIVIMMIVPPDIQYIQQHEQQHEQSQQQQEISTSSFNGMWDDLKRSLSWTVLKLVPGQVMDVQCHFQSTSTPTPKSSHNNYKTKKDVTFELPPPPKDTPPIKTTTTTALVSSTSLSLPRAEKDDKEEQQQQQPKDDDNNKTNNNTLNLPVLVRCDGDSLFSKIQVDIVNETTTTTTAAAGGGAAGTNHMERSWNGSSNGMMGDSSRMTLKLVEKTRVLYRKV